MDLKITRSKTRWPIFRDFLNIVCWNYSPEDKEEYAYLFNNLSKFIPCDVCREHYQNNMLKVNLTHALESNENMNLFLVGLHNLVNKSNNERERKLDEHFEHNILPLLKKESE